MPKRLKKARRRVDNATDAAQEQVSGTARNTRELAGSFRFDRILPNGVVGLFREFGKTAMTAAGRGSGREQVWASIKMIALLILATPLTFGYSLAAAIPFFFTLFIGLLRMIPAANDNFQDARGNNLRDRDVPWWKD